MLSQTASAELLYTLSQQLNTSLDLDEVMGRVLQLTVETIGAMRGSLFLLNDKGEVSHYVLARPHQSPAVSRHNVAQVMTRGLSGWVYRQRQGALVINAATDERWIQLPDDTDVTNSALGVPLLHQNRVNGVLTLHHEQVGFFDEAHLSLAATIAGQAAIAVENARLFTQIKTEHETLSALITGMPIPMLVINAQEQVVFASQSAHHLLALESIGLPLEHDQKIKTTLETLRQNPDSANIEVTWPDGRVFTASLNDVPRLGAVITLNDITYLKELEAMTAHFVESVSHDLKSPLSTIQGYATLLGMENLSERGRANLANLLQGVEEMQTLIVNLLDLARVEAGLNEEVELCDLAKIIAESLTGFELSLTEKAITLTTGVLSGLPKVAGNPLRFSQVVTNLVGNAIKYTPPGGRIWVGVSQVEADIQLRVADNGPGIPPEELPKIFNKFYRVPARYGTASVEGTGLGLSIVKAVVERYGGRIWVESEVDVGSTFVCALPVVYP